MTKNNAHNRPHCVDFAPKSFAANSRPSGSNRASSVYSKASKKQAQSAAPVNRARHSQVSRSKLHAGAAHAGAAHTGAVRRVPAQRTQPRFTPTAKLSAALACVLAGILWTTVSTGTDKSQPAPVIVQSSIASPAFFFDDAADALAEHFSRDTNVVDVEAITITVDAPTATIASSEAYHPPGRSFQANPLPEDHDLAMQVLSASEQATPEATSDPLPSLQAQETVTQDSQNAPSQPTEIIALAALDTSPSLAAVKKRATSPDGAITKTITVESGNTLSGILNKHGVDVDQMPQLLTDDIVKQHLSNLSIGQQFELSQTADGDFHSLSVKVGNDKRITIRKSANDFAVASIDLPVEKERVVSSGTIEQSLYLAAEQANLKQSTIMELADIFQWELDFARDIRKGDQFSLVYDRLYREEKYIGDGDILAAEFVRGGKKYQAIRFTTDDGVTGYFSPEGDSKRRTFRRHPVDVARITSKFNPNRLHPVLHQIRAHRGVDYGSPYGSPIYATADGTVKFSGSKNAYGKTVILQHGNKFSTLYAHVSKISDKSAVGKRVKQGDVIGYVGNTGRVTGTHLHYEFRVNNKQIDPLKVELPAAAPIAAQYLPELRIVADEMIGQMKSVLAEKDHQVASSKLAAEPDQ